MEKRKMGEGARGPSPQRLRVSLPIHSHSECRGSHGGFWPTSEPKVLSAWSTMGWEGGPFWGAAGRDPAWAVT